jgi:hypothetical protein
MRPGVPLAGALRVLTRSPEIAALVRESDIPEKLVNCLRLFHDETVELVAGSVYNLCKGGAFHPAFMVLSFLELCTHLLLTSGHLAICHLLQLLEAYALARPALLAACGAISAIAEIVKDGAFECRRYGVLVLLAYAKEAPEAAAALTPPVIDSVADSIQGMAEADAAWVLEACGALSASPALGRRMAGSGAFTEMLEASLAGPDGALRERAWRLAEALGFDVSWG